MSPAQDKSGFAKVSEFPIAIFPLFTLFHLDIPSFNSLSKFDTLKTPFLAIAFLLCQFRLKTKQESLILSALIAMLQHILRSD